MHTRHDWTSPATRRRSAAAAVLVALALATPVRAAEPDLDRFKAEIDAFLGRLGPTTNGVLKWAGSDPYEIRRDGGALVAIIANARLSLHTQHVDHLTLDRIEIRQIGQKEDGRLIELALQLPTEVKLDDADGTETTLSLKEARADVLVEAQSGRGRETAISIAGARIDQVKTGAWLSIGPLSMQSKLAAEPDGGWSAPVEFEAKEIHYLLPQGPFGGGIDRIAFRGRSAGPKLDELDKLRDAIDRLQSDDARSPEGRGAAFLAFLPTIATPFSTIRGDFAFDDLTVRDVTGEALVSLAKAASTVEVTGLDTEAAAVRFSIRHQGLGLASSIIEQNKVPHRAVIDVGISELATQALGKLLQAAGTIARESGKDGNGDQQNGTQAIQQALGAAAMLNPTFHIYDIAIDTADVGMDLTAEATGSPLTPKGYAAAGDLVVRGFDAIPELYAGMPFAQYFPVVKVLGIDEKAPDGTPRVGFHLASTPQQWITINGNDVSAWFDGAESRGGQPRLLKPSDPPMHGSDVSGVQRALAAAKITVEQNGIYDTSTAAAVARFQKQKGINVSGVVDPAARRQLGLNADAPPQGGRN